MIYLIIYLTSWKIRTTTINNCLRKIYFRFYLFFFFYFKYYSVCKYKKEKKLYAVVALRQNKMRVLFFCYIKRKKYLVLSLDFIYIRNNTYTIFFFFFYNNQWFASSLFINIFFLIIINYIILFQNRYINSISKLNESL